MLISGTVFFVIITLFYFIPGNLYFLIAVRFLHGVGVGLATTATGTIVAQVIPPSRRGEGIGYFSLSAVLSTAVGPLIGLMLIDKFGYTSIFVFSLVMGIVSLLIALPVRSPKIEYKPESERKGFSLGEYFRTDRLAHLYCDASSGSRLFWNPFICHRLCP